MAEAVSPGSIRKAGRRPKGSRNKRTLDLMQRAEARGARQLVQKNKERGNNL